MAAKALQVTTDTFEEEVLKSDIPVLIDFWASWCPPCKMVDPVINELSEELDAKVKVVKCNVDQNQDLRAEYNVMGVPTFVIFNDGKEIKRAVGAHSGKQLLTMIEECGF